MTVSADGSHNTVANSYKLLNFGCFLVDEKGIQSFCLFFYAIAPEEAEKNICMVTFLKYAQRLFNKNDFNFKGMAVSDHSLVFVNIFLKAFPKTTPAQCWPHIIQKFKQGTGTLLNFEIKWRINFVIM